MTLSDNAIRLLLDDGPWTGQRMSRLAGELGSEAEAERLVRWWCGVEVGLRRRIDEAVLEPTDLVLLGLDRAGRSADLSLAEQARLEGTHSRYETSVRQVPAIDDVLDSVGADAEAFDEAWRSAFQSPGTRADRPPRRRTPLRRVMARFAMAASVVAFGLMAVLILQRDRATTTVAAGDGLRVVNLEDGTSVRLLSGATLSFSEGAFDRRVELDGRGYFNVRPDAVPFQVLTPSATVTVLGTSFGVYSGSEETDVVLVSGRVAVSPTHDPDAIVVLEPGERTRIARGASPSEPRLADAQAELDWTGLLFFRSTPLSEVARRLSQAFDIRVEFDPSMAADRLTGTFDRDRDPEEVLQTVASALGAQVRAGEPGVILLQRN